MPEIVIAGAGKIGRGFIAQLFHRSAWAVTFIDHSESVVTLLKRSSSYRVDIAGRPELTETIPVAGAVALADEAGVAAVIARADLLACAVGAANLATLAERLAPALARRRKPLDWLICENATTPATTLATVLDASGLLEKDWRHRLGLVETQVLRSGMDPDPAVAAKDPLVVRMQDWWTLPCDRDAFRAGIPTVEGLQPRPHFANELQRKVYTFNGLNGPICYLGHRAGHRLMDQAAADPALQELLTTIRDEINHGLIGTFGFDAEEQRRFQALAWAKYRDPSLADPVVRHGRDSARKLGPTERLIGPATLCLTQGRQPVGIAQAIAAAIRFDGSDDPGTLEVQAELRAQGIAGVVRRFCGLDPASGLGALILAADAAPVIDHHPARTSA